jgi:hypothetical protein
MKRRSPILAVTGAAVLAGCSTLLQLGDAPTVRLLPVDASGADATDSSSDLDGEWEATDEGHRADADASWEDQDGGPDDDAVSVATPDVATDSPQDLMTTEPPDASPADAVWSADDSSQDATAEGSWDGASDSGDVITAADVDAAPPAHVSTVGAYQPSTGAWYLAIANQTGTPYTVPVFIYGNSTDVPVVGDWTGSGVTRVGLYRASGGLDREWLMASSNQQNTLLAVTPFTYGLSTDIPVVGHWTGSGPDTIGNFRPSEAKWYLGSSNQQSTTYATSPFVFGTTTDIPVVGDWTGNGVTRVGFFRPSDGKWYLASANQADSPYAVPPFVFGGSGDIPVAGDWTGSGVTRVGMFRPSENKWYLASSNQANSPYAVPPVMFGGVGFQPVVGHWTR